MVIWIAAKVFCLFVVWASVSHLVYRILLQTDTPMELRSPITKMLISEHLDWHRNRWGPTSDEWVALPTRRLHHA
jgi:hypothetical protein